MNPLAFAFRVLCRGLWAIPVTLLIVLLTIVGGMLGIGHEMLTAARRVVGGLGWCFRSQCASCQSELASSRFQTMDFFWLFLCVRPKRCTLCMQRQRRIWGC